MKCGFCNGTISSEEGQQPIVEDVRVMGPIVWSHDATAYVCPHCSAVLSIDTPAKRSKNRLRYAT